MNSQTVIDEAYALSQTALSERVDQWGAEADPSSREAVAVSYYRLGQTAEAAVRFSELVKEHSLDVRSRTLLMRLTLANGQPEQALRLAKEVIAVDPRHQEALRTAGRICNQARDIDRGDRFWRQLVEVAPQDPEAALQVARIAARRGHWETVGLYAALASTAAPALVEPWRLRMDAAIRHGELLSIARVALPELYARDPSLGNSYIEAALASATFSEASELIAAVRARAPDHEVLAIIAQTNIASWLSNAQTAEIEMRDAEAARLYLAILAVDPDIAAAIGGLKRLSRDQLVALRNAVRDRQPEAEQIATQILDVNPTCGEALLTRGRIRLTAGQLDVAEEDLAACRQLEPDSSWALLNHARALARLARLVEAREAYAGVIAMEAASAHAEEAHEQLDALARSIMRAASAALGEERYHEAAELLLHCIDVPDLQERARRMFKAATRPLLINLKQLYADGAEGLTEAANRLLALEPGNVVAWQILARSLMNARRYGAALPAWEKLGELEPEVAHYRLQIARCCQRLRLPDAGAAAAAMALQLDPTLDEARSLAASFGAGDGAAA